MPMPSEQKDRLLKLYNDNYESQFKGANYLFVAHGAGLLGCLALLRDYASTPQYKGVGFFIVAFGVGLIAALFYYISLAFSRSTALNSVMDEEEPNKLWVGFLLWINVPALLISLLALLLGIFSLMGHFSSL
jgi:hypothetical protein